MDIFATTEKGPTDLKVWVAYGDQIPIGKGDGGYGVWYEPNAPHMALGFAVPIFDGDKTRDFRVIVKPEGFAVLAREMMKTDPQQAIKAFGKAMQDVPIQTEGTP
jgi:hypothetical protein